MIPPRKAWAAQIDTTNGCIFHCSNCTRMLDHAKTRYFMGIECFEKAVKALSTWVTEGDRDPRGKVVGIIGGEPLLHPQFPEQVDIMIQYIPNVQNRGLWTSLIDWATGSHKRYGAYLPHIERLVGPHKGNGRGIDGKQGWLNFNPHTPQLRVHHQPVLAASKDLVPDLKERRKLQEACWLQNKWSPSINPNGFFFCEVAAAQDIILGGVGGIPVDDECWRGELYFKEDEDGVLQPQGPYAQQILNACDRCGVCVPLEGRLDSDEVDDITVSNFDLLTEIGTSPRLRKGGFNIVKNRPHAVPNWNPRQYRKGA